MKNNVAFLQAEGQRSRGAEGNTLSPLLLRSSAPLLLLLIVFALLQAACGRAPDLETPPEIVYGEDVCVECGMIISDPRFAAAYVTSAGDARLFDDIGDMLVYDQRMNETVHAYWVHDLHTSAWARAETATFVTQSNLNTPMGWGIIAFATAEDARLYVQASGGVMATLAELQTAVANGSLESARISPN
ncbi:MAG: nitrous oxide reductase accessory protein NosL [Chloroflexi bacterium]|nr:nitrous oxide reductase accessory protein NosL [Chloroflexota bacterium]